MLANLNQGMGKRIEAKNTKPCGFAGPLSKSRIFGAAQMGDCRAQRISISLRVNVADIPIKTIGKNRL
jgi:hypothetical protein